MNVIFLDIDGVLTSARVHIAYGDKGIWHRFDPAAVEFFGRILRDTGASLVISSTWRRGNDREGMIRDLLQGGGPAAQPMVDALHQDWSTPVHGYPSRGAEIAAWLSAHPDVTGYLIVDDDSDMLAEQRPNFIQTHYHDGILTDHYLAIRKHVAGWVRT